jgi:hypothetical protein
LFSEAFKIMGNQTLQIERNNSFLNYLSGDEYFSEAEIRAKNEFSKNVEFARQGTSSSGNRGDSLLFWASGGNDLSDQKIRIKKYNAFADVYQNALSITRPWNWASLVSNERVYFLFGQNINNNINSNISFPQKTDFNLINLTFSSLNLNEFQFNGGSEELLDHPSNFNEDGIATNGYFATYRTLMTIYYRDPKTVCGEDTTSDIFSFDPSYCNRFNSITHNYSGSKSNSFINTKSALGDSVLFVQNEPGLVSLIQVPGIHTMENVIVNKAELVFTTSATQNFAPLAFNE